MEQLAKLGFTYRVYDKLTPALSNLLAGAKTETCRWSIKDDYFKRSIANADLVFMFTHPDSFYDKKYSTTIGFPTAFAFVTLHDTESAYLSLLCNREYRVLENGVYTIVSIPLGALLQCMLTVYLKDRDISYLYLNASTTDNVEYYKRFGYQLSNEKCSGAANTPDVAEDGFRMRLCDISDKRICKVANKSINQALKVLGTKDLSTLLETA